MGRECRDVLSYHKAKGIFYKYMDNGKTKYFGHKGPKNPKNDPDQPASGETYETALDHYYAWKRQNDNPVHGLSASEDGKRIALMMDDDCPDIPPTSQNAALLLALGAMREMIGQKSNKEREAIYDAAVGKLKNMLTADVEVTGTKRRPAGHGMKLSEVLAFWKDVRKPTRQYYRDCKNRFELLTDCIGDIHFSTLTADHMRQFLKQLVKDNKSANNRAAICGAVKLVLNFCLKPKAQQSEHYDQIAKCMPSDLRSITALLNIDTEERTAPDVSCTLPFPAKEFKAITKAITDAKDKRFLAVWLLSCNCGLNLTDIGRLVWGQSLNLDDSIPHMNLSRLKRGKGERHIPLHSKTVKALRDYRKTLPTEKAADGQPVFWGTGVYHNLPASGRSIRDEFKEFRAKAKINGKQIPQKWMYKHLRNVGPNVRIKAGLTIDQTWAFLGHDNHLGEAQKYEYREPGRLMPLVASIGQQYF